METRFIDGGEYVDRQAYIDMRDENSRLRERITELEAENHIFRMAQKACESCDAPTMQHTKELQARLDAALRMAGQLALDERWNERFTKVFSAMEAALGGDDET